MSSAICFNLDQSKILSPGNRLMPSTELSGSKNDRFLSVIVESMLKKGENTGN